MLRACHSLARVTLSKNTISSLWCLCVEGLGRPCPKRIKSGVKFMFVDDILLINPSLRSGIISEKGPVGKEFTQSEANPVPAEVRPFRCIGYIPQQGKLQSTLVLNFNANLTLSGSCQSLSVLRSRNRN